MSNENTQNPQAEQSVYDRFEGPFDAIAYLLMTARLGLENKNMEDELPRYVRLARAQQVVNEHDNWLKAPAEWAIAGTGGLNFFVSRLITLTLDARDLLKGTDAILALTEIALEMIDVTISTEFWTAIGNAFGPNDGSVSIPSDTVIEGFNNSDFNLPEIKQWLEYIPAPEDLDRIGYELYRMSCLVYKDDNTINIEDTGKLRLLQYTFGQNWEVFLQNEYVETTKLGQEEVEAFSDTTIEYQPQEGGQAVELFTPDGDQISEVTNVLSTLQYDQGANQAANIRHFQKENDLATEGQLNEETINRFFNLDSENKNLARAKERAEGYENAENYPVGYLPLINGNADDYESEGIALESQNAFRYRYYKVRTETVFPEEGQGWVQKVPTTEGDVTYINGFVAVESRFMDLSRKPDGSIYEGGTLSEGEAASGRFFFAARHVEPWIPGRRGVPSSTLIYDDAQTAPGIGSISRMFQDVEVNVTDFLNNAPTSQLIDEYQIAFQAICLRRSLYTDRNANSNNVELRNQPDQGRILLEAYHNTDTTPAWSDPQIEAKDGWQPGPQTTLAYVNDAQINQRNNWFRQTSQSYVIDASTLIDGDTSNLTFADVLNNATFAIQELRLRVMLEGKHYSGWDVDAYFDNVQLKWMFIPKSNPSA